jgi:hypothetical protein
MTAFTTRMHRATAHQSIAPATPNQRQLKRTIIRLTTTPRTIIRRMTLVCFDDASGGR